MSLLKRLEKGAVEALGILFNREWLVNACVTGLVMLALEYDVLVLTPSDFLAAVLIHLSLVVVIGIRVKWGDIQDWVEKSAGIDVEDVDDEEDEN